MIMKVLGRAGLRSWLWLLPVLLFGCQNADQSRVVYSGAPPVAEAPAPVPAPDPELLRLQRARILADMLYAARIAYDDNRLMTPPGNNAYDAYREVLEIDPENAVARQGITDIALRYVELADVAMNQAQYDNAASLLTRGERVQPGRPEIADARKRLAAARENKVETFELDPRGLSSQNQEMLERLAQIARYIRASESTFLINARNDAEGRWIYQVMRESVEGYRLRGNIAIAGTPTILVSPAPG